MAGVVPHRLGRVLVGTHLLEVELEAPGDVVNDGEDDDGQHEGDALVDALAVASNGGGRTNYAVN